MAARLEKLSKAMERGINGVADRLLRRPPQLSDADDLQLGLALHPVLEQLAAKNETRANDSVAQGASSQRTQRIRSYASLLRTMAGPVGVSRFSKAYATVIDPVAISQGRIDEQSSSRMSKALRRYARGGITAESVGEAIDAARPNLAFDFRSARHELLTKQVDLAETTYPQGTARLKSEIKALGRELKDRQTPPWGQRFLAKLPFVGLGQKERPDFDAQFGPQATQLAVATLQQMVKNTPGNERGAKGPLVAQQEYLNKQTAGQDLAAVRADLHKGSKGWRPAFLTGSEARKAHGLSRDDCKQLLARVDGLTQGTKTIQALQIDMAKGVLARSSGSGGGVGRWVLGKLLYPFRHPFLAPARAIGFFTKHPARTLAVASVAVLGTGAYLKHHPGHIKPFNEGVATVGGGFNSLAAGAGSVISGGWEFVTSTAKKAYDMTGLREAAGPDSPAGREALGLSPSKAASAAGVDQKKPQKFDAGAKAKAAKPAASAASGAAARSFAAGQGARGPVAGTQRSIKAAEEIEKRQRQLLEAQRNYVLPGHHEPPKADAPAAKPAAPAASAPVQEKGRAKDWRQEASNGHYKINPTTYNKFG